MSKIKKIKIALGVIGFSALSVVTYPYWLTSTNTVLVTDKLIKGENNFVYTDKTTYTLNDTWYYLRLDSQDPYGNIVAGNTYEIKAYGIRFGNLDIFPNIISAKQVK